MLAKTLLPDPEFLLLDEPASGLDPHGRAALRNILQQLAANGRAVLISSHVLAEMNDFCTAVGIMQRGRMVVTGTIADVATRIGRQATLLLEVVGGAEILEQVLAARGLGPVTKRDGGHWEVGFEQDRDAAADLLAEAVQRGARIASFSRRKESLEDLFLQVGAKEVS
jgi:ABC-2 type transport system ATP-binding protein